MTSTIFCLRRGYQCKCDQCLPWIRKWQQELDGWTLVNEMIENGSSLFQIYDRLQAEFPDLLQHHKSIEQRYIEKQIENTEVISKD